MDDRLFNLLNKRVFNYYAWIVFFIFLIVAILKLLVIPLAKSLKTILMHFSPELDPNFLRKKFGDWAVVTGATDGVGKEYAKELAKRNINVVIISRTLEKLNRTKEEIEKVNASVKVKIIQADFSQGKDAIQKIKTELGDIPVGILVNNVGLIHEYPMFLGEVSEDELWDIINVNIGATTLMTRLVIEKMKERKKGAIVNISSASTLMPFPLLSVYSSSKVFVTHFSESIRAEYEQFGVTVQCLSPFYIRTKMVGYSQRISASSIKPDEYAAHAIKTLGRLDSTAGYWLHDLQTYITLLAPKSIRVKLSYFINELGRDEFLMQRIR